MRVRQPAVPAAVKCRIPPRISAPAYFACVPLTAEGISSGRSKHSVGPEHAIEDLANDRLLAQVVVHHRFTGRV